MQTELEEKTTYLIEDTFFLHTDKPPTFLNKVKNKLKNIVKPFSLGFGAFFLYEGGINLISKAYDLMVTGLNQFYQIHVFAFYAICGWLNNLNDYFTKNLKIYLNSEILYNDVFIYCIGFLGMSLIINALRIEHIKKKNESKYIIIGLLNMLLGAIFFYGATLLSSQNMLLNLNKPANSIEHNINITDYHHNLNKFAT